MLMMFKGQPRSILKITLEDQKEMTEVELAEYRTACRRRISAKFATMGDPRNWNGTSRARRIDPGLQNLHKHYDAWLRGDWNDSPGVKPPPSPNKPSLG